MINAAAGFRAKTGRAIAVVLCARGSAPEFIWRDEISLVDPSMPATGEPYHEVMELPWREAVVAVQPLVAAIEAVAVDALNGVIGEMRARGVDIRGVGVVGSAPRKLESIGNYHIRAHAAEGVLFRRVLENAASARSLACVGFSESEIKEQASNTAWKEIGRVAGAPWRTDERLAAAAAWSALSRSV